MKNTSKPVAQMSRQEAEAALAREQSYQAKGLSFSGRRIGALKVRLAAFRVA